MILGDGTLANALRHHLPDTRLVWVAWDTPTFGDGRPDTRWVLERIMDTFDRIDASQVVICSQLPVGTCRWLEDTYPAGSFVVYPENMRAAHAVEDFASQPRIVLGSRDRGAAETVACELKCFTDRFIFTDPETAEMTKHAINGFLALSVRYAQEIARVATEQGADPHTLAEALLSDHRIGPNAYLRPAGDLGPHLTREVHNLLDLGGGRLIEAML